MPRGFPRFMGHVRRKKVKGRMTQEKKGAEIDDLVVI
jgi:hypothetical protein